MHMCHMLRLVLLGFSLMCDEAFVKLTLKFEGEKQDKCFDM